MSNRYYVHPTAIVDDQCEIGDGSRVWQFTHIMSGARIGRASTLGQNVFIGTNAVIGNGVKIQNNVSIFEGVELEDYVFCGPSCVFTNVINPRAEIDRKDEYKPTLVRRGATIGANATIMCGTTIGRYGFIAAGAVVISNVPDYALMAGVPASQKGWISRHGNRLDKPGLDKITVCSESGWRYRFTDAGTLECMDWPEDRSLPF